MEAHLALLLDAAVHPASPDQLAELTETIRSLGNRPDSLQAYLVIISSADYTDTVRLNACIQIRNDVREFWTRFVPTYDPECMAMLLEAIPQLLVNAPPFLQYNLSHLTKLVVQQTRVPGWPDLLPLAVSLLGSPETFLAGLVLCKAIYRVRHDEDFEQQLNVILVVGLEYFTDFHSRARVMKFARLIAASPPYFFMSNYASWAQCIDFLENWTECTRESAKFAVETVHLFSM
jgi:hypothetical protein